MVRATRRCVRSPSYVSLSHPTYPFPAKYPERLDPVPPGDLLALLARAGVVADRHPLALVALLQDHPYPRVVQGGEDLPGTVPAPVVDDEQLDLAGIVDRERLFERLGDAGLLVVDRHQDRQLHPVRAFLTFATS